MYLPFTIARRIRLRSKGDRGTSTGMIIAVTGMSLAVIVMMAAISIVTGFKKEITQRVAAIQSDIVITYTSGAIGDDAVLKGAIANVVPSAHLSFVADMTGMLKTKDQYQGITFRGIRPDYDRRFLDLSMESGSVDSLFAKGQTENKILLSATTATTLNLKPGDRVDAYFVNGENVRGRRYTVAGIFNSHFADYDRLTAFVSANSLPGFNYDNGQAIGNRLLITGLKKEMVETKSKQVTDEIINMCSFARLQEMPDVTDLTKTGEAFFNWLALIDGNVTVILTLMGVVAAFTLISSLFIIILRKVKMIGILKAMGASTSMIANIFVLIAMRITIIGLLIGDCIGLSLLYAQQKWQFIKLSPESYYLDYVPVDINLWSIVILNICVAIGAFVILLGPARMVATINPSVTMRYE